MGGRRFWQSALGAETLTFLTLWAVLMTVPRRSFFGDPGSLWHIVLGERMLASGRLIHADPFSFTCGGTPWVSQYWLVECVLALLHRSGGLDSIMVVAMTGLAALYAWVTHRLLRQGLHPLLAVLIVVTAVAGAGYHFHPRPHLLTLAFLGVTFAALIDFEAGRTSLRRLFRLVPLFVVWANVHGGMVAGVLTVGMAVFGWTVMWAAGFGGPVTGVKGVLGLGLFLAACALAALVNPYGLKLLQLWFALLGSPVLPSLIQEHFPMLSSGAAAVAVLPIAILYAAALLGAPISKIRVTWLIPLVWFYLTWARMRNGPLFGILAALALGDLLPQSRWVRWLAAHGSEVFAVTPTGAEATRRASGRGTLILAVGLLSTSLVLQAAGLRVPLFGRGWAETNAFSTPTELLPELRAYEHAGPPGTPIFNEMIYGGFLIYFTPGLRVFIDDRCELYGDRRLLDYAEAVRRNPGRFDAWSREYPFGMALLESGSRIDRHLAQSPDWTLVKRTATSCLYRRSRS